nr:hypothetical protein [Tanacetum cinerariifolium]
TTKYASPTLTQKVFANMRRVGKGFSGVKTPLFEGMLVGPEIEEEGDVDEHIEDVTAGDDAQGDDTAAHGEVPTESEETGKREQGKSDKTKKVTEDVVTTAKLITEVVTASYEIVTTASAIIFAAEPQVPAATIIVVPAKVAVAPSRRRKGVVIRDPEEELTT